MCGMSRKNAIDIIKAERECVERQGRTGECCREEMEMGCGACDLVMEDVDIIEAYNMAIEALKRRHGHWRNDRLEMHTLHFGECSQCGEKAVIGNFCMWCGNDNRVKEGETNENLF